jgi:hypothetical protein
VSAESAKTAEGKAKQQEKWRLGSKKQHFGEPQTQASEFFRSLFSR